MIGVGVRSKFSVPNEALVDTPWALRLSHFVQVISGWMITILF
jgi:hypothetical protein